VYCRKYPGSLCLHADTKKSTLDCVLFDVKNFGMSYEDAHDKDDWQGSHSPGEP